MGIVIKVENLGKKYIISHQQERYTALRDVMANTAKKAIKKVTGKGETLPKKEEFWALRNISFEVNQGDRIGIIGRNGAGKSTLLKLLSRITEPTTGKIKIKGKISSLLEVGTGFHPELTGKENIFLNGAVLGMSKKEILKKMDEIVEFSGVEKFLDTPVKRYSSGMYVRLAFAVAANLETEILLVDEVLAVGDAEFQKKCLGKMKEVSEQERTVLFVSHNMQAIQTLCKNTVLLENGRIIDFGPTDKVVTQYLNIGFENTMERIWNNMKDAPGNEFVRIKSARVLNCSDDRNGILTVKTPLSLTFEFWNLTQAKINLSLILRSMAGECIFNVVSDSKILRKGLYKSTCNIPSNLLNDNIYCIQIMFVKDLSVGLYNHENILSFEVHDVEREGSWYGKWIGAVRPKLEFNIEAK